MPLMSEVASTLWVAAGASAVAATALALAAPSPRPRGWGLWQAAAAMTTAAIALAAALPRVPGALLAAQLLLLPWPLLALGGMRRFHARLDWPGNERHDRAVLALCALLLAVGGLWREHSPSMAVGVPGGTLLAHLYAASLLVCAGASRSLRPVHLLGAVIALAACAPMAAALAGLEHEGFFEASAIATALAVSALAFVAVTLVHVRHEHRLQGTQRQWQALARTDPLTRLPGWRPFERLAARMLASDPPASCVLAVFDFDPPPAGAASPPPQEPERVLRLVARSLRGVLRAHDLACHHGREGFTLLLRRTHPQEAMRVAERLAEAVRQASAPAAATPPAVPTLSFGLVQVGPGEEFQRARQRALQALALARGQGRARIVAAGGSEREPRLIESRGLDLRHA
jgi:diguanylate cyclase (GGDEF)-like protein